MKTCGSISALSAIGVLSFLSIVAHNQNKNKRSGSLSNGDGTRLNVWHQTSKKAADSIKRQGFKIDIVGARASDDTMPNGVFLKFDQSPIGVVKKENTVVQIPVEAETGNMLRVMDRKHLTLFLSLNQDSRHSEAIIEKESIDNDYKMKTDEMFKEIDETYKEMRRQPEGSDSKNILKQKMEEKEKLLDSTIAEWGRISDEKSAKAREISTKILKERGYDSILMERDVGGPFDNRVVRTLVVLDPKKVKMMPDRQ